MLDFDISELGTFSRKVSELSGTKMNSFLADCAKALAVRLISSAAAKTPVDTGTLRRGWSGGKAGNGGSYSWAQSADIKEADGYYSITVTNPVEYASFVEYGRRTGSGGWVPGRFMMTISAEELQSAAPGVLESRLRNFLEANLK